MKRSTLVVIFCTISTLVPIGHAQAFETKLYHGNTCDAWSSSQAGDIAHTPSGIRNASQTSSRWISCPVLVSSDNAPFRVSWVTVYGSDPDNSNRNFLCTLTQRRSDGSPVWSGSATSYTSSEGGPWLTISGPNAHYGYMAYEMYCRLPPRIRLNGYRVEHFVE